MYLDAKLDPIDTNITCFCDVEIKGTVTIKAIYLDYPAQVQISDDNKTFAQIPDGSSAKIGPHIVFIRYVKYAGTINAVCLQFTGNDICSLDYYYRLNNKRHVYSVNSIICHCYTVIRKTDNRV